MHYVASVALSTSIALRSVGAEASSKIARAGWHVAPWSTSYLTVVWYKILDWATLCTQIDNMGKNNIFVYNTTPTIPTLHPQ